jgi:hypothetical protein
MPPKLLPATDETRALEARVDSASKALQAFPRGPLGMIPDEVKRTPEYRAARAEFDAAFSALRRHNAARRRTT